MKKIYTKPLIDVEAMTLDQPIASCDPMTQDLQDLLDFGWFAAKYDCDMWILPGQPGKGGYYDWDRNNQADDPNDFHDTVCYHTNVQVAFKS